MNYAVGGSGIDTSPFLNYVYRSQNSGNGPGGLLPPQYFEMDYYPELGYEQFLRSLNLSSTQERTMRQAYQSILNQWMAQPATMGYEDPSGKRWLDFLSHYDFNRELARMTPQARGENPERFTGRTRWVTA